MYGDSGIVDVRPVIMMPRSWSWRNLGTIWRVYGQVRKSEVITNILQSCILPLHKNLNTVLYCLFFVQGFGECERVVSIVH